MVIRTKERALDPLLVPALPALSTPSICWLRSAACKRVARHPGAASVQLHGCARHCRQLCQSLRALKSCVPLAPSQPHSRRVNMCELVWGVSWASS